MAILYICDEKACNRCNKLHGKNRWCFHTSQLEHSKNYKEIPSQSILEDPSKFEKTEIYPNFKRMGPPIVDYWELDAAKTSS